MLQHWKGKVLYWKQRRAAKVWNKQLCSLLELTDSLRKGSLAAAKLAEALAEVTSAAALKAPICQFKKDMNGILPQVSGAQAAASRLSTTAPPQISLLVQRLFDFHSYVVNASAQLNNGHDEALQKLNGFVRLAFQLAQDAQDVDVDMGIRWWRPGDHEGPASDSASAYKEFWDRLEFEHDLLNRMLTWLLSSQTILFAAYGLTVSKNDPLAVNFQKVIAGSGAIAAALMFIGILSGVHAKRAVWRNYQKDYNPDQKWGVRTGATWAGLVPDLCLPVLFVAAWLIVLWHLR
jgi:hypothetical protein